MFNLILNTNQDKEKGHRTKIRTEQYIKPNTRVKEIQQLNPVGPTTDTTSGPNPLIYR